MPDKDFDKLFKDRFMDAEIEPSADLWGNIAAQLEPKKKRSFPMMWMAAASVVVVASVMLATQNSEKVQLRGATTEVASVKATNAPQTVPVANTEEATAVSITNLPATKPTHSRKNSFMPKVVPVENLDVQKNIIANVQPSEKNEHLPIKKAAAMPLDVTPVEEVIANNNTATVYAANPQKADYIEEVDDTSDSKKGIRNMGDLINYVVEKVDKRDKKLIKFNTDDDDNSSIIGLNIGFLKLNKKNK